MIEQTHIVAVGMRTPLGLNSDASVAAFRTGISAVRDHPFFEDRQGEPVRFAMDYDLDIRSPVTERLVTLANSVLLEICSKITFSSLGISELPVFVALPEERPGWGEAEIQKVCDGIKQISLPLKYKSVEPLPFGHAAGLIGVQRSQYFIHNSHIEMAIVLGIDSYLDFNTLVWLDHNKQLANAYNRGAFFPGEAGCAVVVATRRIVSQFKLSSLAKITGIGSSVEEKKIKTDSICLGEGLTACVKEAVRDLTPPEELVHGIICDINGERYRAEEWGFVTLQCPEYFVDPTDYDLPATGWGDVGAASGTLFTGLAIGSYQGNWAKGNRYLIWNSSENGNRVAALLELNV